MHTTAHSEVNQGNTLILQTGGRPLAGPALLTCALRWLLLGQQIAVMKCWSSDELESLCVQCVSVCVCVFNGRERDRIYAGLYHVCACVCFICETGCLIWGQTTQTDEQHRFICGIPNFSQFSQESQLCHCWYLEHIKMDRPALELQCASFCLKAGIAL